MTQGLDPSAFEWRRDAFYLAARPEAIQASSVRVPRVFVAAFVYSIIRFLKITRRHPKSGSTSRTLGRHRNHRDREQARCAVTPGMAGPCFKRISTLARLLQTAFLKIVLIE